MARFLGHRWYVRFSAVTLLWHSNFSSRCPVRGLIWKRTRLRIVCAVVVCLIRLAQFLVRYLSGNLLFISISDCVLVLSIHRMFPCQLFQQNAFIYKKRNVPDTEFGRLAYILAVSTPHYRIKLMSSQTIRLFMDPTRKSFNFHSNEIVAVLASIVHSLEIGW